MKSEESIYLSLNLLHHNQDDVKLDKYTQQLIRELRTASIKAEPVNAVMKPEGSKSIDPAVIGAIAITILPQMVEKTLDILHSWVMRHKEQVVKIKYKSGKNVIEVEVPYEMSRKQLDECIRIIRKSNSKKKK